MSDPSSPREPPFENPPHELTVEELVDRLDQIWRPASRKTQSLSSPQVTRCVGRYTLSRIIGQGAFGIIYEAHDSRLNRVVALKLPRRDVLDDEERRHRFETEAKAAATLVHPAIVPLYEARLDGPIPYIVSEFVPGPDLGKWLAERTDPVPIGEAVRCVAKLADAVHFAHRNGIVHRDLKPGNVLLAPNSNSQESLESLDQCQPRLTDFGLAKLVDSSLADTRSSLLIGTPLYMAPERLEHSSDHAGPAADVYALGVMLFELLTLTTPFVGTSYVEVIDKLRREPPPQLSRLNPDVKKDLEIVCTRCLEKDPRDRYPSAGGLAEDLRKIDAGETIGTKPIGRLQIFRRWCREQQRIRQAGNFSLAYNFLTALWITFSFSSMAWMGLIPKGHGGAVLNDAIVGIFGILLPKAWIAWRTKKNSGWAPPLATAVAAVHLGTVIASGLGIWPFFDAVYHSDAAVRWLAHGYLILGSAIEVSLYAISVFASAQRLD